MILGQETRLPTHNGTWCRNKLARLGWVAAFSAAQPTGDGTQSNSGGLLGVGVLIGDH